MKKPIDLEVGKFYKGGHNYIKVEGYDNTLEPIGVMITFFEGHVSVTNDTDLYYLTIDGMIDSEITKEEFEARLYEAQRELAKLCKEIKKSV